MVELGELESHFSQFAKRDIRIVAISNDSVDEARNTQRRFPHLAIVSDADQNMAKAIEVIHPGAGPNGEDTNAPTTFLVDNRGQVRWYFRPTHFISRLSPDELLEAIDRVK